MGFLVNQSYVEMRAFDGAVLGVLKVRLLDLVQEFMVPGDMAAGC